VARKAAYLLWHGLYYPVVEIIEQPVLTLRVQSSGAVEALPTDGASFDFEGRAPRIEFVP
jgi:hypothetical protein